MVLSIFGQKYLALIILMNDLMPGCCMECMLLKMDLHN